MPIRNVFLDLDDTILNFHQAEHDAIRATFAHFGIAFTEEKYRLYSAINLDFWRALERGEITREKLLIARFEALYIRLLGLREEHPSAELTQKYYEKKLSEGHEMMPGAREALDELAKEYDLYLASNGNIAVQKPRIADSGIAPYFKEIFISEEIGVNKPSPEYFDRCFARMPGKKREETVIVGDSLTSDILGGIRAQIRTVWYNPYGSIGREDIHADAEIASLSQLGKRLKEFG